MRAIYTVLVSECLTTVVVIIPTPVTINQLLEVVEKTKEKTGKQFSLSAYMEINYGSIANFRRFAGEITRQAVAARASATHFDDRTFQN